jgi:anaerobic selenocysteine-containing dehydrogenase
MPLLWKRIVEAQREGAKLIVIDPERTHEARRADLWLQTRPGSDVAVALGLINRIVAERLYDEDTVSGRTVGFDELSARAAEYPPERVAELAWVTPEALTEVARVFARGGPAIIHGGNGLCQSGSMAVQCGRALACLVAITGNVGVHGGHALPGPPRDLISNGDAVLADALPPGQRAKRLGAETFPHIGSGYGELDAALSAGWYGKRHILSWLATGHEPTLWKAITTGEPYPVKAVIVQYHNALGAGANARLAGDALTSDDLELLVVQDLFVNPTSRLADYLLPASHWLEKPYFSVAYGYMGFAGDYAEASEAALPAEFEHRSDYDLWRDLGRRLGQAAHWPDTAELFWDELARPAGLRFDALAKTRGPLTGADARVSPAPTSGDSRLGTPSGKIELSSSLLRGWGIDAVPDYRPPGIFARAGDGFPLILITGGRTIEGFHQNAQQMRGFRRRHPHPRVRMHASTAADAGVREGEWVLIETPVGAARQQVRVADELAPRVVQADRWWYPERGDGGDDPFGFWSTSINLCTDNDTDSCDPVMGTWLLRGLPCRIAPNSGEEPSGRPPRA